MTKATYSANIRPEWRKGNLGPTDLSIFGYLVSCARINKTTLEHRIKHNLPCGESDKNYRIISINTSEINKTLSKEGKVKWKSAQVARSSVSRSLVKMEKGGMISIISNGNNQPGSKIIEMLWDDEKRDFVVNSVLTARQLCVNSALTACQQGVNAELTTKPNPPLKNKARSGNAENNTLQVSKVILFSEDTKKIPLKSPQRGEQVLDIIPNEDTNEVKEKVPFLLTEPKMYGLVSKDKSMVQLWNMNRPTEPKLWPIEYIKRLEDFILELNEKWGYQGGLDNDKLNLAEWMNNPAHKELVAPWLHESIHYTDFRDMPSSIIPEAFKKHGFQPCQMERMNRVLLPGKEEYRELALNTYSLYAQPFNNPFLSPTKKGLAFIRLFPFGYHIRDEWMHPWSPPLVPWAVVADNKDLLEKWNKRYWHSGFHPFQQDTTTSMIRQAIALGNKEVPDDSFFDKERYDNLPTKPSNIAGARTNIISNTGPFQLLYWLCGNIGVSPTVMIDAYKRWETYNGKFAGMSLTDKSNVNADKIRIFATYLKNFSWGSAKEGSFLPREQGVSKALSGGQNQEWFHQGVLGGATVLVRCYDGAMREVWLTNYQKAIYDLKFNPQSEKDKEILDDLLAEML